MLLPLEGAKLERAAVQGVGGCITGELLRGKLAKSGQRGPEGVHRRKRPCSPAQGSELCAVDRKDTHLGLRAQGSW